jgi:ferrous iron transport protein B
MSAKGIKKLLLVGNPNVGKSVIFGHLTGKYATVSNYPGTTVELSIGNAAIKGEQYAVTDTPGVNSLLPMSEDEVVTRDILINEDFDSVLQVSDMKNLRRSLPITIQLAEMGVPFSMVLNMEDEANDAGIETDLSALAAKTGLDAVPTTATRRKGMGRLKEAAAAPRKSRLSVTYDKGIEDAAAMIEKMLPEARISRRSIALMILGGDRSLKGWLHAHLDDTAIDRLNAIVGETQAGYTQPLGYVINNERLKLVDSIVSACQTKAGGSSEGFSKTLGRVTMHPVWGVPILLGVLILMYEFVGVLGAGTMVDFMETVVFGELINPYAIKFFETALPVPILKDMFIGEYGIVTMALTYAIAIVFPITTTFFIAFGILEDSGYLPRLAIMLNKVFNLIGLNGKAVLPMVLGLGCSTMATLTTRILDTKKERIIVTLLLALGIPCSAQLGVIMGMLAGISAMGTVIWASVVVFVVLLVGYLSSKVIKGEPSDFVLELPPIRLPKLKNILMKTLGRIEWYVKEAVPLFILGTLLLFTADKLHLLVVIERAASPLIVGLLGLPSEATGAFLIGFLRRDYGAAGLFALQKQGMMDPVQVVVSLVVVTLFVPCIAQFFMTIKERGMGPAIAMVTFVLPFAILVGTVLNFGLRAMGVTLQ